MAKHKRRLQKKLHLGEFAEMGFEVSLNRASPETDYDLLASLSAEALFPNGMAFLYLSAEKIFVSGVDGTLTDESRAKVESWAKKTSAAVSVGPLVDAWYPPRSVRAFLSRRQAIYMIQPRVA